MKALITFLTLLILGFSNILAQTAQTNNSLVTTVPMIVPTPVSVELGNGVITLGNSVVLVASSDTDPQTVALVRSILSSAGVETVNTARNLPSTLDRPYIILGTGDAKLVQFALKRSGASPSSQPEGYTFSSVEEGNGALITLAGNDSDGLFYAAQTFRQLAQRRAIPALVIQDYPSMPIRGTIEGFYGKPWSMEDRTKHLNFLASVKANTYIYSPKDDPYARDQWRETYPTDILKNLGSLVATARQNHVNFVYAISPGPTICFSDPADLQALERKFETLRSIGVQNFYVALDDIEYTEWNCEQDRETYGPSGTEAAGIAQSELLNKLQATLDRVDPTARALIMVPTEYYNAVDSPYKAALRENLDPQIVVQWTGTDVVPPSISVADARKATEAFGRKTLLWDNYPVNDFGQTAGRLLLAPYRRREAGLSEELSGILSNPMNQEAPSRVALTGVAAFAWNDEDYDAERTWHAAARNLAGGDKLATEALLTFFDTQHLAPTFGSQPWQEQAPGLKMMLDEVRDAIAYGNEKTRGHAINDLIEYAAEFARAPDIIRSGTLDSAFIEQSRPWLDAMQLWGRAFQLTAAGLHAADQGSTAALRYFAGAERLAEKAAEIETLPGATRPEGRIKIADGVLDEFITDAPKLIALDPT